MCGAKAGHAHEIDFSARNHTLFIHQPGATGRGKAFDDASKRRAAPVIVVSRNAIHRGFDAGQDFERFGQKFYLFHDIAGKTHEIGLQRIDHVHDGLGVGTVAFVVQIGEMNEAMGRRTLRQPQPAVFYPLRFEPQGIGDHNTGRGQQSCGKECAAAEFARFH